MDRTDGSRTPLATAATRRHSPRYGKAWPHPRQGNHHPLPDPSPLQLFLAGRQDTRAEYPRLRRLLVGVGQPSGYAGGKALLIAVLDFPTEFLTEAFS